MILLGAEAFVEPHAVLVPWGYLPFDDATIVCNRLPRNSLHQRFADPKVAGLRSHEELLDIQCRFGNRRVGDEVVHEHPDDLSRFRIFGDKAMKAWRVPSKAMVEDHLLRNGKHIDVVLELGQPPHQGE